MKIVTLLLLSLVLISCSDPIETTTISLTDSYQWQIDLPNSWDGLPEQEKQQLTERGERLARERGNTDTEGFEELLMITKGDTKLMAALGTINEAKYGKYEEARAARAAYYRGMLDNQHMAAEVTMDSSSIRIGELALTCYRIRAVFDELPVTGETPFIGLQIFETKLDEEG